MGLTNAHPPAPRPTVHAIRPEQILREAVGAPGLLLGGKYLLEKRIASGGNASIWSATHVTLNRPVAVKFIEARTTANREERVGLFLREAKVAASIRHKNVVDILDFGAPEDDDISEPYMVMELLEGEALDLMLARGPLSTADAVFIARQVLSGLEAVHDAGIVHRDMKPGNVFVTQDGDGVFARVLDFGISQSASEQSDHAVVGTPEYMSPEQAYGDPLDGRTDLYSVGVMLYEMLAGYLPFDGEDPVQVLQLVAQADPLPLEHSRADVPELCRFIDKAMARRPDDRFQTAREMHGALIEAFGDTATTGPHSAAARTLRESGQFRRDATTITAPSEDGVTTPVVRRSRVRSAAMIALGVIMLAGAASGAWLTLRSNEPTPTHAPIARELEAPLAAPPLVFATPLPPLAAEPAPSEEVQVIEALPPETHSHHAYASHVVAPAEEIEAPPPSEILRELDF